MSDVMMDMFGPLAGDCHTGESETSATPAPRPPRPYGMDASLMQ
jgi:hypothetical protein